jgi:DNA polymerase-1
MSIFEQKLARLPKSKYEYVIDGEKAKQAVNDIVNHKLIAVDTETTALDPYEAKVTLVQIATTTNTYVFDIRHDTNHSTVHPEILKPVLTGNHQTRIVQNAAFDMKMMKMNAGFYIENIYDPMLVEQLFNLGISSRGSSLEAMMLKYLGLTMDKEPRGTFVDYNQVFNRTQLDYAANDVVPLFLIYDLQTPRIQQEGFENVVRLEFEFTKPLCEMELNGIILDVFKWRALMSEIDLERNRVHKEISDTLSAKEDQLTMFGVSTINIDSNVQLKKSLIKCGLDLDSTGEAELKRYAGLPLIDNILDYRKANKLISTYAESLIDRINSITGRLHTAFRQMVSTGRMSSSNPNLQNIPKKQKFRNSFISRDGYSLITADMSGAELRILGNLSDDPIFIHSYANGIDLHTKAASEVYSIDYDKVTPDMRDASKAIQFGLCYGLSKFGLAKRLKITEKKAEEMITKYFTAYSGVKKFLDKSGQKAVLNGYSLSISGRKRFYRLPALDHPERQKLQRSVERKGKNAPIQGANADTIKESMIILCDRLEKGGYDAKLLLTVHDELIVEAKNEQRYEVAKIVENSLIDGFGKYFHKIPMETDSLIGPCWLKGECNVKKGGCGHTEFVAQEDKTYGTKVVCAKCGKENI